MAATRLVPVHNSEYQNFVDNLLNVVDAFAVVAAFAAGIIDAAVG